MLAEDLQKALGQAISEYYAANMRSGTLDIPDPPKIWVDRCGSIGVSYNETENVIEIISANSIQDCITHWIACSPEIFEHLLNQVPRNLDGSALLDECLMKSSFWVSHKNKWSDTQINLGREFSVAYSKGTLVSLSLKIKEREVSWEIQ
jgi:hypothetical protein